MTGLLNSKECAEYLGVTRRTLYRWIEADKIPYLRIENGYRFDIDELKQWIRNGANNEKNNN